MLTVRYAKEADIPALQAVDPWPKPHHWQHKILSKEVIIAEQAGELLGHLRFELLWSTVPFLSMIHVVPSCRGKGISRSLLDFLEQELLEQGYVALLSSSQTDEPVPQKWHVRMGFHSNGIIENIADDNVGEIVYRKLLKRD